MIILSSHCTPSCQEKFEPNSQKLIFPSLSLIKCDISNQLFPFIDHLKQKYHFCSFKAQMAEFENEKTLSWCHKSNWNVSQMLALKKLWSVDFEIFTAVLKL